jgi:ParB/RepB/Spo0J family partition protein
MNENTRRRDTVVEQASLLAPPEMVIIDRTLGEWELPDNSTLVGQAPDKALLDSIRLYGILNPLVVQMENREDAKFKFRLVDGRRRLKAARTIGLREVPVRSIVSEEEVSEVLTVNVHATRSDNVAADVEAIERLLMTEKGDGTLYNERDIAKLTGLGLSTVQKRLRLVNLIDPLRVSMDEGKIAPGTAEAAAKLTPAEQERLIPALDAKGRINRQDIDGIRSAVAVQEVARLDFGALAGTPATPELDTPSIVGPLTQDALADAVRTALESAGLVVYEGTTATVFNQTIEQRLKAPARSFVITGAAGEEFRLLIR